MAQTAAHLVDHVIPPVPVRQWVIFVPKRLRWFLGERPEAVAALTKIFMREVERLVRGAADDMLAWEHCGFSIDTSVRNSLDDRDVPSYTKSLEHLVRYWARPAVAHGSRLTVIGRRDNGAERIRYTLPRHKRGQWIGPGRNKKATAPDSQGVVNLTPHDFHKTRVSPIVYAQVPVGP